jgi:hypothetical protein
LEIRMKTIDVFVKREGSREAVHREVEEGSALDDLKEALEKDLGPGPWFLFTEDADEPLPKGAKAKPQDGGLFLHQSRCRRVTAVVRYAGRSVQDHIGPGATLGKIKRWAEKQFGIGAADAAELALQIAGTDDRPDEATHVGSLVMAPACAVTFDLLPTDRINGDR